MMHSWLCESAPPTHITAGQAIRNKPKAPPPRHQVWYSDTVNRIGAQSGKATFKPIARPPLLDEVVKQRRAMINDGAPAPGCRIPERALCKQRGLSRTPLTA